MSKPKKIRLLSYQNAHNYGAVLQAYGLQSVLKEHGYDDVKFINYNPCYLSSRYIPIPIKKFFFSSWNGFRTFIRRLFNYPFLYLSQKKRNIAIKNSINNLLFQTDKVYISYADFEDENLDCDVLICGSDQIWNKNITNEYDPIFFGEGKYYKGRLLSYAPSTEIDTLTPQNLLEIAYKLKHFDAVSVRERPFREKLEDITHKPIAECIDPTLLAGYKIFDRISSAELGNEKYILIYSYSGLDPFVKKLIHGIPNYKDYAIKVLSLGPVGIKEYFRKGVVDYDCSVEEFVGYFKNASYVITNSFHGLAFSVLFHKNFYVTFVENKYIRCLSLLKKIGLESRMLYTDTLYDWSDIDYKLVDDRLNEFRDKSLNFLLDNLK